MSALVKQGEPLDHGEAEEQLAGGPQPYRRAKREQDARRRERKRAEEDEGARAVGGAEMRDVCRRRRLDKAPLSNDRRHAFRLYGTYELPFGPGHKWNIANPVLSRLLGGWTVGSIAAVVSGFLQPV